MSTDPSTQIGDGHDLVAVHTRFPLNLNGQGDGGEWGNIRPHPVDLRDLQGKASSLVKRRRG